MTPLRDINGVDILVDEGESCNICATLEFKGVAFSLLQLQTLTLTLYDARTKQIINGRQDQNVLNANDCTVSSAGLLTIRLEGDDNPINNSSLGDNQTEKHVARIEWTWNDGVKNREGKEEVSFLVKKLVAVTV